VSAKEPDFLNWNRSPLKASPLYKAFHEIDLKRFRITVHLVKLNELLNNMTSIKFGREFKWRQYSPPIEEILRNIPAECTKYYAKIDLADAYHSIGINRNLWKLFCVISIDTRGQENCWCSRFCKMLCLIKNSTTSCRIHEKVHPESTSAFTCTPPASKI
jgi:hypothetical protein